jgi:medium-chain acyl-[acyl-carrier-protein] hydrolase
LIQALADAIVGDNKSPFAFFGHSLGALIAFELARYCRLHGLRSPVHLLCSGCEAPQHRSPSRQYHELDEDGLIDVLKEYRGTPAEALENRELMAVVLPVIRADFELSEKYCYAVSRPLDVPITVLAGKLDDQLAPEQLQGWQKETSKMCRIIWFEGDHFFLNSDQRGVVDCIESELARSCRL